MKNHRLVAALGILTILCSQVHAQSSDLSSTQIRFAQDGLTYTIDYTKIRLGFTAIRLYQGYNIGEFFFESPKVYQDYKNYVERRADDLESSLQVLRTSIGQAAAKLDAASQHLPTIAEEANLSEGAEDQSEMPDGDHLLDWDKFEVCSARMLPLLKSSLALGQTSKDPHRTLDHVLALNRGSGGLICGNYLGKWGDLFFDDVLSNVKFLLATSSRALHEKRVLFNTLVAAYHADAPPESRKLYAHYYSKLTFLAVFSDEALPSYSDLKDQLMARSPIRTATTLVGEDWTRVKSQVVFSDLSELTDMGAQFIHSLEMP